MPDRAGPPPVNRNLPATTESRGVAVAEANYAQIVDTLKRNNGAEAKAIRAMFGGDKALMDRFLAVAFSSLASNSDLLMNADPMTVIQAVKDSAALGLEPTGLNGEGWIIRYGKQAQFQPGWRGYLKRIRNSGKVVDVDCQIVFMNDEFMIRLGTNPEIFHAPILVGETDDEGKPTAERGDYRGVYAWALMPSGKYIIEYLTTADINSIRDQFSQGFRTKPQSNPWTTSWPEMARKTVIRRLAKRLPGEAVDHLLVVEARNDAAADEMKAAVAEVKDGLADVRRLAIAAASGEAPEEEGATEQNGTTGAPAGEAEAQGGSETEQSKPSETPAEELCGAPSPYVEGHACVLPVGHAHNHRGPDRSTWNAGG